MNPPNMPLTATLVGGFWRAPPQTSPPWPRIHGLTQEFALGTQVGSVRLMSYICVRVSFYMTH